MEKARRRLNRSTQPRTQGTKSGLQNALHLTTILPLLPNPTISPLLVSILLPPKPHRGQTRQADRKAFLQARRRQNATPQNRRPPVGNRSPPSGEASQGPEPSPPSLEETRAGRPFATVCSGGQQRHRGSDFGVENLTGRDLQCDQLSDEGVTTAASTTTSPAAQRSVTDSGGTQRRPRSDRRGGLLKGVIRFFN